LTTDGDAIYSTEEEDDDDDEVESECPVLKDRIGAKAHEDDVDVDNSSKIGTTTTTMTDFFIIEGIIMVGERLSHCQVRCVCVWDGKDRIGY
jgi:hypothetical protein